LNPNVLESIIGLIVPVALLAIMEVWARAKGTRDKGFDRIAEMVDPTANVEPTAEMKRAVKHFSHMAISCFVATLGCISVLLVGLLCFEEYEPSVARIMIWGCVTVLLLSAAYIIYRVIDARRSKE
jgi:predicted small integral membrane protein